MNITIKDRFIKEVRVAARENPNIDMKLVREWQAVEKIIDSLPSPEREEPKPIHLQPIPLQMFSR